MQQVASVFQALGAKTLAQAVGQREEALMSDRDGCESLSELQVLATTADCGIVEEIGIGEIIFEGKSF